MAVIIDEEAQQAITRRRARSKDARVFLRLERHYGRAAAVGSAPYSLKVGWAPRRWPRRELVCRQVGDTEVYMDRRLARYSQRQNVTISAFRLGPIEWLTSDDVAVVSDLFKWERPHPAADHPSSVHPPVAG